MEAKNQACKNKEEEPSDKKLELNQIEYVSRDANSMLKTLVVPVNNIKFTLDSSNIGPSSEKTQKLETESPKNSTCIEGGAAFQKALGTLPSISPIQGTDMQSIKTIYDSLIHVKHY